MNSRFVEGTKCDIIVFSICFFNNGQKDISMQNAQASRFLSLLDPTASAFTFQTVPEPKGKPTNLWPQVVHGSLNDLLPKLTDLNRQGAAIYVTVNETDGKGRKAANITRIPAIWQDDDCGY